MKRLLLFLFVCLSMLSSCCYHNPVERNTLRFTSKTENVESALFDLQKLLNVMPKSHTIFNTNYYFHGNNLYINSSRVGNVDSIILDTVKAFSRFSNSEKIKFMALTKYLVQNQITSGYLEQSLNIWLFGYRELPKGDYHDTRQIAAIRFQDSIILKSQSKILDRKNKLFLIAPKDAKIR